MFGGVVIYLGGITFGMVNVCQMKDKVPFLSSALGHPWWEGDEAPLFALILYSKLDFVSRLLAVLLCSHEFISSFPEAQFFLLFYQLWSNCLLKYVVYFAGVLLNLLFSPHNLVDLTFPPRDLVLLNSSIQMPISDTS